MPHNQKHRGKHPSDDENFNPKNTLILLEACKDLVYLLSRKYSEKSALELVGNRYLLNERQRKALQRACVAEHLVKLRQDKALMPPQLIGKTVAIDAYNVLILCESALSGGCLFQGNDACYRDIASIHGTYRRVEETKNALFLISKALTNLGISQVHWYLDSPISNSGKLKSEMLQWSAEWGHQNWAVSLVYNPDRAVAQHEDAVAFSSDGYVLNECKEWFNFSAYVINNFIQDANIIRFFE